MKEIHQVDGPIAAWAPSLEARQDQAAIFSVNKTLVILAASVNAFYLISYPARNALSDYLFGVQVLGLNHYDKQIFVAESKFYAIASLFILAFVAWFAHAGEEKSFPLSERCRSSQVRRPDPIRFALMLICIACMAVFYLSTGAKGLTYEEVHKAAQENPLLSKLLYSIVIYLGYEFGVLINVPEQKGKYIRLFCICVAISIATGMRSFVILYLMMIAAVNKISILKLLAMAPVFILMMTFVALARSAAEVNLENLVTHITLFLGGAASQVDLFYMGKALNIGPRGVDAYFEETLSSYFESGGGLGAFLPLELTTIFPPSAAMAFVILIPAIFAVIIRGANSLNINLLIACLLVHYPIIIRNPISSWVNGVVAFTIFAYYGKKSSRN